MMMLGRDVTALLGVISLSASALLAPAPAPTTTSIHRPRPNSRPPATALGNMFRGYQDEDYGYGGFGGEARVRSARSGASSPNWRKNQGYNLSRPTPLELGGSYNSIRDAETNPYYDPVRTVCTLQLQGIRTGFIHRLKNKHNFPFCAGVGTVRPPG